MWWEIHANRMFITEINVTEVEYKAINVPRKLPPTQRYSSVNKYTECWQFWRRIDQNTGIMQSSAAGMAMSNERWKEKLPNQKPQPHRRKNKCSPYFCFRKIVEDSAIVQPNYHVHKDQNLAKHKKSTNVQRAMVTTKCWTFHLIGGRIS